MTLNSTLERLQKTPFSAQKQIVTEIKQVVSKIFGENSPELSSINKFKLIDLNFSGSKKKIAPLIWTEWELIQKRELSKTLYLYIKTLEMKKKGKI